MRLTRHGHGPSMLGNVDEDEPFKAPEAPLRKVDERVKKQKSSRIPAMRVQTLSWQLKETKDAGACRQQHPLRGTQQSSHGQNALW